MGTHIPGQLTLPVTPSLHPFRVAALARRVAPGWQAAAGCVGAKDPEAWFPHEDTPPGDLLEPLTVCAACPVRSSCLAAGLLNGEHGLWGGVTEPRRRDALTELTGGARVADVLRALLAPPADDGRNAA